MNNRQIDALIAEHVFQYTVKLYNDGSTPIDPNDFLFFDETNDIWDQVPDYSTQIQDAWLVVEKMREKLYWFDLSENEDGSWFAAYLPFPCLEQQVSVHGVGNENVNIAICLAALKALGVKYE